MVIASHSCREPRRACSTVCFRNSGNFRFAFKNALSPQKPCPGLNNLKHKILNVLGFLNHVLFSKQNSFCPFLQTILMPLRDIQLLFFYKSRALLILPLFSPCVSLLLSLSIISSLSLSLSIYLLPLL